MSVTRYVVDDYFVYENDDGTKISVRLDKLKKLLGVFNISLKTDSSGDLVAASGTNNMVLFGEIDGKKVVMRFGTQMIRKTRLDLFQEYAKEYEYSKIMQDKNIGPEIYYPNAPFTSSNASKFCYELIGGKLVTVFVMEYFNQGSLADFLEKNVTDFSFPISFTELFELKKEATRSVIDLITRMVDVAGVYCVDIKPQNFVVNIDYDPVTHSITGKTRMIDFGADFCFEDMDELIDDKNANRIMKNILFVQMLGLYMKRDNFKGEISSRNLDEAHEILQLLVKALDDNDFITLLDDIKSFGKTTYDSKLAQMITWYSQIIENCTVKKNDVEDYMKKNGLDTPDNVDVVNLLSVQPTIYEMMNIIENTNDGKDVFNPFIEKCMNDIYEKIYNYAKDYENKVVKGEKI